MRIITIGSLLLSSIDVYDYRIHSLVVLDIYVDLDLGFTGIYLNSIIVGSLLLLLNNYNVNILTHSRNIQKRNS